MLWVVGGMIPTGGSRNYPEESLPNATLSTTNSKWTGLELNPRLHGERPGTNRLKFGGSIVCVMDFFNL